MMNSFIAELYKSGLVYDSMGKAHQLHSHIDLAEGEFISELIKSDPTIKKTCEIGCAYGLSSLHICSALSEKAQVKHIIIDPAQYTNWHGIGKLNLERAGFDFYELIEQPSEFALPELARNQPNTFDFVFIDGWHTFDHTLLDLFYANLLIQIGGYIVLDDCNKPAVSKAVSYFANYPSYILHSTHPESFRDVSTKRKLGNLFKTLMPPQAANHIIPKSIFDKFYQRLLYPRLVALTKIKEDNRSHSWFMPF